LYQIGLRLLWKEGSVRHGKNAESIVKDTLSPYRAKRRGALALLAVLFLLAVLSALRVSPWAALFPLFLAVFTYVGYAQEARRVLEEEAARRLGLAFSPKPELPAVPLLPEGEPKAHGERRGEVLDRPFRRFEVQVYGARRFGAVGYRFTGVLYEVELPRPFPPLHLAPRGWPTYPRERWPFLLALLFLLGVLLALLARYLEGRPVLKPGTSPLLPLITFPALFLYLFAAWRVATREAGPEVALEGELARRFRAWGTWDSIGEKTPLGQALLEARRVLGPFWLQVVGGSLYLAFLEGGLPTSPLLSPEAALERWEARLRGEMGALEGLLRALEAGGEERLTQDRPLSG
jgi:Ca2+/Na+ antiporter